MGILNLMQYIPISLQLSGKRMRLSLICNATNTHEFMPKLNKAHIIMIAHSECVKIVNLEILTLFKCSDMIDCDPICL